MIKDKVGQAVGTTNEIISLCKEVNFGKNQISNMLLLYRSICLLLSRVKTSDTNIYALNAQFFRAKNVVQSQ